MKLIPNMLSGLRLWAGGVVIVFVVFECWDFAVYVIIAGYLSDLLDGPIARRFNAVSVEGKYWDLGADVVFDVFLAIGLVLAGKMPLAIGILISAIAVLIRLPPLYQQMYMLGTVLLPFWAVGMVYVAGVYVIEAFGVQGIQTAITLAVPTAILVAWFKRERIKHDLYQFKKEFFG